VFHQSSLRLMDEAHASVSAQIDSGEIFVHPKLTRALVLGQRVDAYVRDGNLLLRDELGLDATTVRINQRLYTPNGKWTVPDLYFPESRTIIDYSYSLKGAKTPQIVRMRQAVPAGPITIIPPSSVRPAYDIP